MKIQKKLFISSIIISIMVCSIFYMVSSRIFRKLILQNQVDYNINSFKQVDKYMKTFFEKTQATISNVSSNPLVTKYTTEDPQTNLLSLYDRVNDLTKENNKILTNANYIDDIIILGSNGFSYAYSWPDSGRCISSNININRFNDLFSSEQINKPILFKNDSIYTAENKEEASVFNIISDKLIYVHPIISNSGNLNAMVIVTFDNNLLKYIFSNFSNLQEFHVLNSQDELIWTNSENRNDLSLHFLTTSPRNSNYVINKINNIDYLTTYYEFSSNNFKLISRIPLKNVLNGQQKINLIAFLSGLFCLIFIIISSYNFSGKVVNPISDLANNLVKDVSLPLKYISHRKRNIFSRFNIRDKFILYFFYTAILPSILFMLTLIISNYSFYKSRIVQTTTDTIKWVTWNIDSSFKSYDELTTQFIFSNIVQNTLNEKIIGNPQNTNEIEKQFNSMKVNKKDLESVNIFNNNTAAIYFGTSSSPILTTSQYDSIKSSSDRLAFLGVEKDSNMNSVLCFGRTIRSLNGYNFGNTIGYLKCFIDQDISISSFDKLKIDDINYQILMMDSDEKVISDDIQDISIISQLKSINNINPIKSNKSGYFLSDLNNKKYLLFYDSTNLFNIKVIGIIPFSIIQLKVLPLLWYGIECLCIFIIIIFVTSTLISLGITNPLRKLKSIMEKVNAGDLNVSMKHDGKDEIAILSKQFNNMISKINELIYENYQSKIHETKLIALQREAQLNALQQQINPHFLYNTLEAIKWMAYMKGAMEASDMANALGKFLRWGISKGRDFVKISEEIDNLQNYIYIQKIRYQNKFDVVWDVQDEVNKYKIVKLTLQPIIENAINHGIDSLESGGLITIHIRKNQENIDFDISDNGIGIPAEQLRELKEKCFSNDYEDSRSNIGIPNVYERLMLRFDNKCNFDIVSEEGKGTKVTFTIPAIP